MANEHPQSTDGDRGPVDSVKDAIIVRVAASSDAAEVARLATELGYATEAGVMTARLRALESRSDHAVLIAEGSGGAVVGWIHVGVAIHLESGESAEILGLVVDRSARRGGVGRRLIAAAQGWSRALGFERLVVRSNAARTESHRFYPALGFELAKTQRVYVKRLGPQSPSAVSPG
jgi:N-acetylglutamate synthase-like GNAT family acetyltransferase